LCANKLVSCDDITNNFTVMTRWVCNHLLITMMFFVVSENIDENMVWLHGSAWTEVRRKGIAGVCG